MEKWDLGQEPKDALMKQQLLLQMEGRPWLLTAFLGSGFNRNGCGGKGPVGRVSMVTGLDLRNNNINANVDF